MNHAGEVCVEVQDGLMEYMLGELEDAALVKFRRHLHQCPACQLELELLVPVQDQLSTVLSSLDSLHPVHSIHSVVPSATECNRVLEGAFALRAPTSLTSGVAGRQARQTIGWRSAQRDRAATPLVRNRLWAVAGGIASVAAVTLVWRTEFAPSHVQTPVGQIINTVATNVIATNTTAVNVVAGVKPSSTPTVLTISLQASKEYPSAQGAANATIDEKQGNLVLNVSHVPVQPQRACYNVWGIVDGQYYSLGEFLVDKSGSGQVSVSLDSGLAYSKIEVTLEPRWGDASPEGPKVLQSSTLKL